MNLVNCHVRMGCYSQDAKCTIICLLEDILGGAQRKMIFVPTEKGKKVLTMAEYIKLKDTINEAMMMEIKPCPFCGGEHTVNLSDCSECFLCVDEPPCDGCN